MSTPTVCIGTYKLTESALYEALVKGVDWIDTATAYNNCKMIGHASQFEEIKKQVATSISETCLVPSVIMVHAPYPDISMMKVLGTIKMICDGLSRVVYGGLKGSETRDVKMAVSNFEVEHLEFIISHGFKPSMNQVEYHVRFQRPELLEYCKANGIELQAYRPLNQGASLEIEEIKQLASKYNTSTALIIYSWLEQLGVSVVGKATSDTHQHDLIIAQRVVLSEDDMMLISNLNRDERTCTKGGWCIPFTEEIKKRWLL